MRVHVRGPSCQARVSSIDRLLVCTYTPCTHTRYAPVTSCALCGCGLSNRTRRTIFFVFYCFRAEHCHPMRCSWIRRYITPFRLRSSFMYTMYSAVLTSTVSLQSVLSIIFTCPKTALICPTGLRSSITVFFAMDRCDVLSILPAQANGHPKPAVLDTLQSHRPGLSYESTVPCTTQGKTTPGMDCRDEFPQD